jgi:hypothetical protein
LDLLTYSIYIFVSLTRLFLNLYTAHSDVGGTTPVLISCVMESATHSGSPSALTRLNIRGLLIGKILLYPPPPIHPVYGYKGTAWVPSANRPKSFSRNVARSSANGMVWLLPCRFPMCLLGVGSFGCLLYMSTSTAYYGPSVFRMETEIDRYFQKISFTFKCLEIFRF